MTSHLGDDFDLFANYYNVNGYGKWEDDKYHLIRSVSKEDFSNENNISETELEEKLMTWQQTLSQERNKRDKPRLDDKTLTAWNALMLKGYVNAYSVFQDDQFLQMALKNAHFIQNKIL